MKLIFATANPGKLREAREILEPHGFEVVSPYDLGLTKEQVDVEETGKTFEENAIIKVQNLWSLTGLPCFADDSGLVVDALGGAPGIYSARYASLDGSGEDHNFASNIDKLLHNLQGVTDRKARFVCVVALAGIINDSTGGMPVPSQMQLFKGTCEGRIAFEPAGCGGFGYDPVFIADAYPDRTLAEVDEDAKNAISHRGNALAAMVDALK
jgi:XTP/dITP diphosphohydrolase